MLRPLKHLILGLAAGLCWTLPAMAQSVTSTSGMGDVGTSISTTVSGNTTLFTVTGGTATGVTVTGGSQQPNTLFHSFEDFSPNSANVLFQLDNSQSAVESVIGRVTGNDLSLIDGKLELTGGNSPDVFLINPNGITFGTNAELVLPGSFTATTAAALLFENALSFSATAPSSAPTLLTISTPMGINLGTAPGTITVRGNGNPHASGAFGTIARNPIISGLDVSAGHQLSLLGGEILLESGVLATESGEITLASLGANEEISLTDLYEEIDYEKIDLTERTERVRLPNVNTFGDITLKDSALVDVSGSRSGTVRLYGREISLENGSSILSQNSGDGSSGSINLSATEKLSLSLGEGTSSSTISSEALAAATHPSSSIHIETSELVVVDGSGISTTTFRSSESGGSLWVNATGDITLGGLNPTQDSVSVLAANSFFAPGKSGDISVTAQDIHIFEGGILGANSVGIGPSGDVTVNAQSILIEGATALGISAITSTAFASGKAGDVTVNTDTLIAQDGGSVTSSGVAQGDGGNLSIYATDSILVQGSTGDRISQLRSSINIATPSFQRFFGLPAVPSGNAGNLMVETDYLQLNNQGLLSVRNEGIGNAGTLKVIADRVDITDGGGIFASTQSGGGGDLDLRLNDGLLMRNRGVIDSEAFGAGDGGNIFITAPVIIGLEDSDIVASAVTGNGGNITITTQGILGLEFREQRTTENDITASSEFGVNGTVEINDLTVDPSAALVALSETPVDTDDQIATACASSGGNQFIASGRGGLPVSPAASQLSGSRLWRDVRDLSGDLSGNLSGNLSAANASEGEGNSTAVAAAGTSAEPNIGPTEANGWQVNGQGHVELLTATNAATAKVHPVSCVVHAIAG